MLIVSACRASIVALSAALLLAACTSPTDPSGGGVLPRVQGASTAACPVRVVQDGRAVAPHGEAGGPVYELAARGFRIEVSGAGCQPSLALPARADFSYIAGRGAVATVVGYEAAGTPESATTLGL